MRVVSSGWVLSAVAFGLVASCGEESPDDLVKVFDEGPDDLIDFGKPLTEFSLIDQNGEPFTRDDLLGKVWVADFIFTNCPGACPTMTGHLRTLADKLRDEPAVHMLSITVDPERDTPEVLAKYAKDQHADLPNWVWLSGTREEVYTLCTEGFLLPGFGELLESGDIPHSQKFVILDDRAHARSYNEHVPVLQNDVVAEVERDIRRVLKDRGLSVSEGES